MSRPILAAILSCEGCVLTDKEKYLFRENNPLGITLFNRNIKDKKQVKKLIDDIRNVINRDDVLIAIDEEGGRVSRLKYINKQKYISAESLAKLPIKYTKMHAELISSDMKELGININYAPVIDRKKRSKKSNVLEKRCFGYSTKKITQYATTMIDSYIDMGICPCLKHIPGHLNINNDPHLNAIQTNLSYEKIKKQTEYIREFSKYPMAMTAHILLKSIDDKYPVTISSKIISEYIRKFLYFDGFLLSDAIDMHALSGDVVSKVNLSLDAGVDAICYCSGKYNELYNICHEKRFMTEKSLIRFANIKNIINNKPKYIDVKNIRENYNLGIKDYLDETYTYDATEVLQHMQQKGEN